MENFEIIQNLKKPFIPVAVLINNKTGEEGTIHQIGDYENITVFHNGRVSKIKMSRILLLNINIAPHLLFLFTRTGKESAILCRLLNDCEGGDWTKKGWLPILEKMKFMLEELITNGSCICKNQDGRHTPILRVFTSSPEDFDDNLTSIVGSGPIYQEAKKVIPQKQGSYGAYRTQRLGQPKIEPPMSTLSVVYTEEEIKNININLSRLDD